MKKGIGAIKEVGPIRIHCCFNRYGHGPQIPQIDNVVRSHESHFDFIKVQASGQRRMITEGIISR